MILGPVSLIDCAVFCLFLAPQLILQIGFFRTTLVALRALPFLLLQLPVLLIHERLLLPRSHRPLFVSRSTFFEDLVVRCVRYAFANIPARIGRVFFSKAVALPFLRWRMIRHGYLRCPVTWNEYRDQASDGTRGIWVSADPSQPSDIVLYYVHGGGFAMGSSYFYLEFLLAWHALLLDSGYKNPAIFALEYTLVPDETYPTQVRETLNGYKHVLDVAGDAGKVVVSGDSAGGALVLTMLLELGQRQGSRPWANKFEQDADTAWMNGENSHSRSHNHNHNWQKVGPWPLPAMAVLISPWVTLITGKRNATSDYLDREQLHEYAMEYAGTSQMQNYMVSPGLCVDHRVWAAASPSCGFFVTYGSEELFAPDIKDFIKVVVRAAEVDSRVEEGGVHAWPVASLFLSSTEGQRLKGLRTLTTAIRKHVF